MGSQASGQITLSPSPLEILQQLEKTFKTSQRPRTCLHSYGLFSDSALSSWERLPDGTAAPCNGLEVHAAAHQLCSGAGSRTTIQPSAGEANWHLLMDQIQHMTVLHVSTSSRKHQLGGLGTMIQRRPWPCLGLPKARSILSFLLVTHQLSGMDATTVLGGRENLPLSFFPELTCGS